MRLCILKLLAAAAIFAVGCDTDVESQIREDSTRPGKVGTLRALEVHARGHDVAKAIRDRVEPACAVTGPRKITIKMRRERGSRSAYWNETRFIHPGEVARAVHVTAEFSNDIGQVGTREYEWRQVGSDVFYREAPEDFYRRASNRVDDLRWVEWGPGTFQSVIDAVGGWTPVAGGFELGESKIVCGPRAINPWLERFLSRGKPLEASLKLDGGVRRLKAKWMLDGGFYLNLDVLDEPTDSQPIQTPANVADVKPEASFVAAQRLLEKIISDGYAKPEEVR